MFYMFCILYIICMAHPSPFSFSSGLKIFCLVSVVLGILDVPLFHSYPHIFVYPLSFKYCIKCRVGTFLYLLLFTDSCFKLYATFSRQWIALGSILI